MVKVEDLVASPGESGAAGGKLKTFRLRRPPLSPAGATSLTLAAAETSFPSPAPPGKILSPLLPGLTTPPLGEILALTSELVVCLIERGERSEVLISPSWPLYCFQCKRGAIMVICGGYTAVSRLDSYGMNFTRNA